MQAINKNSINFPSEYEKIEILQKLKNSYNDISSSPKLKLSGNSSKNIDDSLERKELKKNSVELLDPILERGKKHYLNNSNLNNNINLVFKEKFKNSNERIDQLLNYYNEIGEKERKYHYSPEIHSFYNKEHIDGMLNICNNARGVNLSKENPNFKKGKLFIFNLEIIPNEYVVMKFNNGNKNFIKSSVKQENITNSRYAQNPIIKGSLDVINNSINKKNNLNTNRINNLKKDLESKNFYEIKNNNFKSTKEFDILEDIQKKMENKNEHNNLFFSNDINNKNKNIYNSNNIQKNLKQTSNSSGRDFVNIKNNEIYKNFHEIMENNRNSKNMKNVFNYEENVQKNNNKNNINHHKGNNINKDLEFLENDEKNNFELEKKVEISKKKFKEMDPFGKDFLIKFFLEKLKLLNEINIKNRHGDKVNQYNKKNRKL